MRFHDFLCGLQAMGWLYIVLGITEDEEGIHYAHTASKGLSGRSCHVWACLNMADISARAQIAFWSLVHFVLPACSWG